MKFEKDDVSVIFVNRKVQLLEDLRFLDNDEEIIVPKGFRCDGSSIPRFFWRVCGAPTSHTNLRPGILHDYLYRNKIFDRKKCDKIYYRALRSCGKSWIVAKLMYYALRGFASNYY
jgi:hypothetical protein